MNTDELRAAAKEITRLTEIPNVVCNIDRWYAISPLAAKLARHVQRMYDATPADNEWLHRVIGVGNLKTIDDGIPVLKFECGSQMANRARMFQSIDVLCQTRGDVRRLCEALGIELREEA